MPIYSATGRAKLNAEQTSDVLVMLVTINHASLAQPVRLSTDPTTALSADPLAYGTISDGVTYEFALMSIIVPDDIEGTPPSTRLVLENVTQGMAGLFRSITTPGTVDFRLVWASAPDDEQEIRTGFKFTSATYDASQVVLDVSREPVAMRPMIAGHMTKRRFPGLHR